jgi:hypothetical protein
MTMSDHRLSFSLFNNAMDKFPKNRLSTWEGLQALLGKDWRPTGVPDGCDPKLGLPGLSGSIYPPYATRAQRNVRGLQLALTDIDNAESIESGDFYLDGDGRPTNRPKMKKRCISNPVHPEMVVEVLRGINAAGYVYTTWNHDEVWPRFRLVVPLEHPIPAHLWLPATEVILDQLHLRPYQESLDLPVLRDPARMSFFPGQRLSRPVSRWVIEGKALSIPLEGLSEVLVPAIPPLPWQVRILQERKRTESTWFQAYRSQGRTVDFKRLDLVGLLRIVGVKVGPPQPYGTGTKWRTHCPWASEHTHGLDDDCAVVIHTPGHWPIWKCAHSHHAHLGLRDLMEAFGGAL